MHFQTIRNLLFYSFPISIQSVKIKQLEQHSLTFPRLIAFHFKKPAKIHFF